MQSIKKLARDCYAVIDNATGKIIAVGTTALLATSNAHAVADVTAITAAQTDLLAYAAALLALGVAVWAALKVVRMFGGK